MQVTRSGASLCFKHFSFKHFKVTISNILNRPSTQEDDTCSYSSPSYHHSLQRYHFFANCKLATSLWGGEVGLRVAISKHYVVCLLLQTNVLDTLLVKISCNVCLFTIFVSDYVSEIKSCNLIKYREVIPPSSTSALPIRY